MLDATTPIFNPEDMLSEDLAPQWIFYSGDVALRKHSLKIGFHRLKLVGPIVVRHLLCLFPCADNDDSIVYLFRAP